MNTSVNEHLDQDESFLRILIDTRKKIRSSYFKPQTFDEFVHCLARVRAMKRLVSICSNFDEEDNWNGVWNSLVVDGDSHASAMIDYEGLLDKCSLSGNLLELINDYAEYTTQVLPFRKIPSSDNLDSSLNLTVASPNSNLYYRYSSESPKYAKILDCPDEILQLIFSYCYDASYIEKLPFAFSYRKQRHTLIHDLPNTCLRFKKILSPRNVSFWKRLLEVHKKNPNSAVTCSESINTSAVAKFTDIPTIIPIFLDPSYQSYAAKTIHSDTSSLASSIIQTGDGTQSCDESTYIELACNLVGRCVLCNRIPKLTKFKDCITSFYRPSVATNICDQCLEAIIDFYEPVSRYKFDVMKDRLGVGYISRPGQKFPSWLSEHVQLARDEEKAFKSIYHSQGEFARSLFRLFRAQLAELCEQ